MTIKCETIIYKAADMLRGSFNNYDNNRILASLLFIMAM